MLARQRHRVILSMLETQPSLRTIELAKQFNVTDETIRRDLEFLDSENKLIRTHGGALRIEKRSMDLPLQKRLKENRAAKNDIARKALSFIKEGETILLDASSSVLALAEILPNINLTVITNAHDCIVPLMGKENIKVIVTGGMLDRISHSYSGIMAWDALKRFSVDKVFFSCNGIDLDRGVSEAVEIHAEFKENAMAMCKQKILLCDSSKFSQHGSRFFANFDVIDTLITDYNADPAFLEKLSKKVAVIA